MESLGFSWIRAVSKMARTRPQKRLRGQRVEAPQIAAAGSLERDGEPMPAFPDRAPTHPPLTAIAQPVDRCFRPVAAGSRMRHPQTHRSRVGLRIVSRHRVGADDATMTPRWPPATCRSARPAADSPTLHPHGICPRVIRQNSSAPCPPQKYGVCATIRINISPSLMRRRSFCVVFGAVVPGKWRADGHLKRTISLSAEDGGASGLGLRRG